MANTLVGVDHSGSYRIYLTDTTDLVQTAQDIHHATPLATAGLGRVLTGTGIMSLLLKKEDDRMTVNFRGDGPAGQILAVGRGDGCVKGYIANPDVDLPLKNNGKLDVGGSLGDGELTVIKDLGLKEPWSGTIAFVSGEIAEDLTAYYYVSEQQNTSFALGVRIGTDSRVECAGGMFIQMLPDAREGAIEALEALLGSMPPITESLRQTRGQAGLSEEGYLESLRDRIFADVPAEYFPRTLEFREIRWQCDCSREKMKSALATIGIKDLRQLAEEDKGAELGCQFCGSKYRFSEAELTDMIETIKGGKQ